MSKKGKNYADLENVRVFQNPKTNLVEITGKYVDGGNFSVVLTKGTKSDEKVRAEIAAKITPLPEKDLKPIQSFPSSAKVVYDLRFSGPSYKDGKIWREKDNQESVFYLPFTEHEKPSMFPLGVNHESQPVLIDLQGSKKKNLFISSRPGSGGSLSLYNLAFHVLHDMPNTKLISNHPDIIDVYKASGDIDSSRLEYLKELGLLEHLREVHGKMINSRHGCKGINEVILMENFDSFINSDISNSPSSRTDKAVRAEILDLIVEISNIDRSEFNVNFVFFSNTLDDSLNAFIDTCHTFIVLARGSMSAAETMQRIKIFGRDLHELHTAWPGFGFVKDEGSCKDGDFFVLFTNSEVVDMFDPNKTVQKKLAMERNLKRQGNS